MGSGSSSSKKAKTAADPQNTDAAPKTCPGSGSRLSGSQVFDSIDTDKSGKLSRRELGDALHDTFGFNDDDVETVFTIMDRDGDGEIDRAEFVSGFDKYRRPPLTA